MEGRKVEQGFKEIYQTNLNLVLWCWANRIVLVAKLTVPEEEHLKEAYKQKRLVRQQNSRSWGEGHLFTQWK